ncbi:MAG: helix-turn-helix domain-containing protein [Gammaproteobacteria bacterium]|nr:helix-turn-helix domain-containing protein [Gammaproteobacteria bacterium]
MTLGEKLRSLRAISGWTQPECAEKIGIEQSYLSKLENDKSIPSADIFDALCAAYKVSPDEIIRDLDKAYVRKNLMHIPMVSASTSGQSEHIKKKRKRIVLISAGLFLLGFLFIYLSIFHSFGITNTKYYYTSEVIELTELKDKCRAKHNNIHHEECNLMQNSEMSFSQKVTTHYMGNEFREDLERGYRVYRLEEEHETFGTIKHMVHFIGMLLVILSILVLIIEARFYRIDKQ